MGPRWVVWGEKTYEQHLPDSPARQGVHAGRRLIEKNQFGVVEEGKSDHKFSLIPAGEVLYLPVLVARQVQAVEEAGGLGRDGIVLLILIIGFFAVAGISSLFLGFRGCRGRGRKFLVPRIFVRIDVIPPAPPVGGH